MIEGVNLIKFPKQTKYSSSHRLREMVLVLRKHNVLTSDMTPEKLRLILEDLGPTFVKLGQILSLKPGFLPADYAIELTKLQTQAKPLDFSIIKDCLEKEYNKKIYIYGTEKKYNIFPPEFANDDYSKFNWYGNVRYECE